MSLLRSIFTDECANRGEEADKTARTVGTALRGETAFNAATPLRVIRYLARLAESA